MQTHFQPARGEPREALMGPVPHHQGLGFDEGKEQFQRSGGSAEGRRRLGMLRQ